jgi:response regulator RpfG family c-di-GMP phosphodiesterase
MAHRTLHLEPQTDPARKRDPASPQSLLPLLVVDDDEPVRRTFAMVLGRAGYTIDTAPSGEAAIDALGREQFAAVICDLRMPGVDGFAVLRHARAVDPEVVLLVISAVDDAATATAALRLGASDYLTKPVEREELEAAVARALAEREARQERTAEAIRDAVAARTAALEKEKVELRARNVRMAEALVRAMEARDPYLKGHSQRMADMAVQIARSLGLDADTIEAVNLAARVADVGKIGTRESVLHKPGPLTPDEYDHVQDHVRIGLEILTPLEHLGPVLDYVRDHHEHYDGTGYPRAVERDNISIGGRILTAADAYVALTSRRSYREPLGPAEALHHLRNYVGRLLDPSVFAALSRVIAQQKDAGRRARISVGNR